MKYPVNEIFQTIQGEAHYTGTPSVFVRLQGCPVGCGWCDTKHTWHTQKENEVSLSDIVHKTTDSAQYAQAESSDIAAIVFQLDAKHVVITGGEPCLYDLNGLINRLLDGGRSVQIETSSTYAVNVANDVWITASPKINMPGQRAINTQTLHRANEVKLPVGKSNDISDFLFFYPLVSDGCEIWLQPLSQSKSATKLCMDEATKRNWKFSAQIHKYLGIR